MPLEGHWERVNTPLRETTQRERAIVRAVVLLVGIAAAAAIVVAISSSSPATPSGCIKLEVASTMGGGATQLCGKSAARFCLSPAAHGERGFVAKCRDAGYAVAPQ